MIDPRIEELQERLKSIEIHQHCRMCGDVIPRTFRFCPHCRRKEVTVRALIKSGGFNEGEAEEWLRGINELCADSVKSYK